MKKENWGERTKFLAENPGFVLMFAKRYHIPWEEREEFVQEAILCSLRQTDVYSPDKGSMPTYAYGFMENFIHLYRWWKKSQSRVKLVLTGGIADNEESSADFLSTFPARPDDTPGLDDEEKAWLEWALSCLSPHHRRVLLAYSNFKSGSGETSQQENVSKQRIFQILKKARKKIREFVSTHQAPPGCHAPEGWEIPRTEE